MKILVSLLIATFLTSCASGPFQVINRHQNEHVPQFVVDMDTKLDQADMSRTDPEDNLQAMIPPTIEKTSQKNVVQEIKVIKSASSSQSKLTGEKEPDHKILSTSNIQKNNNDDDLHLRYSNKLYKFWIRYFNKRARSGFKRHMENSLKYQKVVKQIIREHGLPADLFYVALIESGYNSGIKSKASAVGYWQFMRGTAKHYGLRVDRSVDERRSIFKSTHAAAKYFKDLYNIFGNWELALLAYNKGEYGVIRAIRKGNSRDYQVLVRKKLLPKETAYYIPKIVAARDIFNNQKRYGFHLKKKNADYLANNIKVRIKKRFDLNRLSKITKVPRSVIRYFNPDLRYRRVRVSKRHPYTLYLPRKIDKKLLAQISKGSRRLASTKKVPRQSKKSISRKSRKYITYKVRRGDNLIKIARQFKLSVRKLKSYNSLRSNKIFANMRLKIPAKKVSYYTVKRGDNLTRIARKFGLSVRKLISYNSLESKQIYPRQKLIIPVI